MLHEPMTIEISWFTHAALSSLLTEVTGSTVDFSRQMRGEAYIGNAPFHNVNITRTAPDTKQFRHDSSDLSIIFDGIIHCEQN